MQHLQTDQHGHVSSQDSLYQRHVEKLVLRRLRIAALLVAILVLIDAVAQYFFDVELFRALFWVRVSAIAICLVVWHITSKPSARSHVFLLGLMIIGIVSFDLEAAIMLTSDYNSPFQTGLAMLIVGAGLLVPFSPRQIFIISVVVWAVFFQPFLTGSQLIGSLEPGFTASTVFMIFATLITLASSIMTSRLRRREFFSRLKLREEQNRSERLLLNILPAPIAARLKHGEKTISDQYDDISVLFADIADFTPLADGMEPVDLVRLLGGLFSEFDGLVESMGLEKIKTIGDAYMVVGGAPEPLPDHAERVADLALAMLRATHEFSNLNGHSLRLRIGIHCGSAVAGVIGLHKFSYDLWGDTVNTASRMESHGVPGKVHVTDAVQRKLEGKYRLEERGEVHIKGKGELPTWFLLDRSAGSEATDQTEQHLSR